MPLYNITLSSVYSTQHREDLEAYVIDRSPQGPLAALTELQDNSKTACDPCGSGMNSTGRNIPNRFAIRLPENVKRAYPSARHKTDYVDSYTLPGFLSWLSENGYSTVDTKHVVPVNTDYGFWLEYTDSQAEEFRSTRAAPRIVAPPASRMSAPPPASNHLPLRIGRKKRF